MSDREVIYRGCGHSTFPRDPCPICRIRELEAEVARLKAASSSYLSDFRIQQDAIIRLQDKLRAVGELPRHRMDIFGGAYFPVVDQARGQWIRSEAMVALLK